MLRAGIIRREMQGIVRSAAEPRQPGDTVRSKLLRAAYRLGLPPSRLKKLWYGEADTWTWESDQIRAWATRANLQKAERLNAELRVLQARLGRIKNADDGQPMASAVSAVDRRAQHERRGTHQSVAGRKTGRVT